MQSGPDASSQRLGPSGLWPGAQILHSGPRNRGKTPVWRVTIASAKGLVRCVSATFLTFQWSCPHSAPAARRAHELATRAHGVFNMSPVAGACTQCTEIAPPRSDGLL